MPDPSTPLASAPTAAAPRVRADRQRLGTAVVLAVLVAAFQLATPIWGYSWSGVVDLTPGTDARAVAGVAGVVVVASVVLAVWRPVLATVVAAAPFAFLPWTGWFMVGWYLALVAVALVAVLRTWRAVLLPYAAALGLAAVYCGGNLVGFTPIGPVTSGTEPPFRWLTFVLYVVWVTGAVLVALAFGARQRSRRREALAQQQEERALTTDALARERARMARDLHDVVAHHVSLIAVRAESAPYQYPDLDDDARAVLADVARDAREALGELREALNVLRRTDDDASVARRPQPTAHDVAGLVADARAAGQDVRVVGEWSHVPDAAGYVLFRALQEALTNARRHAPGAAVDVELVQRDGEAGLRVSQPLTGPAEPVRPGRGLVGMRERVDAVGGTLRADATASRFVVDVRVPVAVAP
jgi:signal transduction histidine kinase